MKKNLFIILPAIVILLSGIQLYAQCEPDFNGCIDIDDPGEICPDKLPVASLNRAYDEVITVIAPSSVTFNETVIPISYIVIDSVMNLPPGITYTPNADKFWADSMYCISIAGTPSDTGEFQLTIYVTPWLPWGNDYVPQPQFKDDTSVVMIVKLPSGIESQQNSTFLLYPGFPNPYAESMKLQFFAPESDRVELIVFNILGVKVYREEMVVSPGVHEFIFDGTSLKPGTYLYRVANKSGIYTGRFVKNEF